MAQRPLNQWLKHAYRSDFLTNFGERRRVFNDDSEKDLWQDLEASRIPAESKKSFEAETPSEERDFSDTAEKARMEQFFINQINNNEINVWELENLLGLEGVRDLFTKEEIKELGQFFEVVSSRRRQHQALMKHEVEETVARKYTEHVLKNNLSNEEAERYVDGQAVEERREIENGVREKLRIEFKNFRKNYTIRSCIKKTKLFLEGRQELRINALKKYLQERIEGVEKEHENNWNLFNEDDPIGPQSTLRRVKKLLAELNELDTKGIQNAARWMGININPKANRLDQILALTKEALKKIKGVEYDIQSNLPTLKETNESREQLEKLAKEKIEEKIDFIRNIEVDKLRFFQQLCEKNQADGTRKENASNAKYLARLIELIETTELRQGVINNEQELIAGLKTMSLDELIEVNRHYEYSNEYLSRLMNFNDLRGGILKQEGLKVGKDNVIHVDFGKEKIAGQRARRAINQIQEAKTPKEIIEILSTTIGSKYFEITQNFDNYDVGGRKEDLNSYTSEAGGMVFYDHGADSKIIIDAKRLYGEGIDQNSLSKMIVHELLHFELEHTKGLKAEVIDEFRKHPKWNAIKDQFKKLGKRPPYGSEFTDEAIAHELYAMQNELGKGKVSKATRLKNANDPKKITLYDLNDLIHDHGFYNKNLFSKAEEERKAAIRGAEEGVSAEELEGAKVTPPNPNQFSGAQESQGSYAKNKTGLDEQKKRIKELKELKNSSITNEISHELDQIDSFLNHFEKMNEGLNTDGFNKTISSWVENAIEKSKSGLDDVDNFLKQSKGEGEKDRQGNFFSGFLNRTNGISIQAIVEGIKSGVETYKRRRDRKQKEGGERLLKATMGNTALGQEASSNLAKLEEEQVNDWKFDSDDPWTMESKLDNLSRNLRPNKHQLKALMRAMAAKGRLDWTSPNLLRALSKIQSAVYINPNNPEYKKNPLALDNVLKKAIGAAYDLDEYPDLLRKNDGTYNSKKSEFFEVHKKDPFGLTKKMERILLQKKRGDNQVNPIEYESLLEFCAGQGKSEPDYVIFYLIAGIAEGILAPNRAAVLNDLTNNFPALDYVLNITPQTQERYQDICREYFPNDFREGKAGGKEFKDFYLTILGNDAKVQSRTEASAINRVWDHDHIHGISAFADAETLKVSFGSKSGEAVAKDTAKENHLVGIVRYMEANADKYDSLENREAVFTRMLASIAMTEGMFSGVAYSNELRSRYGNKDKVPREGAMGNHPGWKVRDYQKKMKAFLYEIDPIFYGTLLNENIGKNETKRRKALQEIKEHLDKNYPSLHGFIDQLNTLDDVFDKISTITNAIAANNHGNMERAIRNVAATNKKNNVIDIKTARNRGGVRNAVRNVFKKAA